MDDETLKLLLAIAGPPIAGLLAWWNATQAKQITALWVASNKHTEDITALRERLARLEK